MEEQAIIEVRVQKRIKLVTKVIVIAFAYLILNLATLMTDWFDAYSVIVYSI